ncbi:hypothetical protein TNCV_4378871 [Trichonephila clavipes]|nr:hypothetical protein TNCV_4378871 [Trichonephila clavipes]
MFSVLKHSENLEIFGYLKMHILQCEDKISEPNTLPVPIDMTVAQPFKEEYPRRCHVPSIDTPQQITLFLSCFTSLTSFADINMFSSATSDRHSKMDFSSC